MNLATGFIFHQPIPVQPMKAIAVIVIAEGLVRESLIAAGLWMGIFLLAACKVDFQSKAIVPFAPPRVIGM